MVGIVNNMKKILLGLITLMFFGNGFAYAGTYLDSAHGNSTHGVDRKSTTQYAIGNCAHCHEQHASIGGTQPDPADAPPVPSKFCLLADNFDTSATAKLYLQSDNVCFYCHCKVTDTTQTMAFDNYSYSRTFGGNVDATPASIMDAFNITSGSYHNLNDILNFAKSASGWPSTFTADSNPCSACHNVHIAQRSCGKPTGSYDPAKSAISKPSDHNNLWGDDDGTGVNLSERMSAYPATYQAPYYYARTPTKYEPANNATSDGSNLPNYAAFCLDCHVNAVSKGATSLTAINWTNSGIDPDKHGQTAADSGSDYGELIAPYANATGIYALSCSDCHEPHGSSNEWLLRTEVNAKSGISISTSGVWYEFCTACHSVVLGGTGSHSSVTSGSGCSSSDNSCHKHGARF